MTDAKRRTPRIAASLVNGLRRSLIEDGTWERVEHEVLRRAPMLSEWLAEAEQCEWVSLEGHLRLLQALLDVLGEEAIAARGAARLREDLDVGPLAPILRAWMRGFAKDPAELMRVAPHVYQAITRDAGRMVLVGSDARSIRFAVREPPRLLCELRGWHVLMEGFGTELLRTSGRQGSVSVRPAPDGESLLISAVWD
ncbi:MAG TPA: hypothetical protein VIL20_23505 [Sandaracinaceae bacterium]